MDKSYLKIFRPWDLGTQKCPKKDEQDCTISTTTGEDQCFQNETFSAKSVLETVKNLSEIDPTDDPIAPKMCALVGNPKRTNFHRETPIKTHENTLEQLKTLASPKVHTYATNGSSSKTPKFFGSGVTTTTETFVTEAPEKVTTKKSSGNTRIDVETPSVPSVQTSVRFRKNGSGAKTPKFLGSPVTTTTETFAKDFPEEVPMKKSPGIKDFDQGTCVVQPGQVEKKIRHTCSPEEKIIQMGSNPGNIMESPVQRVPLDVPQPLLPGSSPYPDLFPPQVDYSLYPELLHANLAQSLGLTPQDSMFLEHFSQGYAMEEYARIISQEQQTKFLSGKKQRPKKYKCPHCDVGFSNNGQLKGHIRIHTGERPFKCDEENCGKTFTRNEELTRHKRIHSGLRPYPCQQCGKKFGRKDHLKKHTRTHFQNRGVLAVPIMMPLEAWASSSYPYVPLYGY